MLNHYIRFHSNPTINFLIKLIIGTGLLVGLGPLVVEMKGQMPITVQSLVVLFVAIAFGWRVGLPAVLIYLTAGALGMPVFAGYHSGYKAFFGPFGGFFFGFVAAAVISGYLSELEVFRKALPAMLNWFTGHAIIILFGTLWLIQFQPEEWKSMISSLLPGAVIKSVIGALVISLIIRLITKEKKKAFKD